VSAHFIVNGIIKDWPTNWLRARLRTGLSVAFVDANGWAVYSTDARAAW